MTLPKDKKLKHEHIESMKIAVEQYDIRAIHPEKMGSKECTKSE